MYWRLTNNKMVYFRHQLVWSVDQNDLLPPPPPFFFFLFFFFFLYSLPQICYFKVLKNKTIAFISRVRNLLCAQYLAYKATKQEVSVEEAEGAACSQYSGEGSLCWLGVTGKRLVNGEYWPNVRPVAEPKDWEVRGMLHFQMHFKSTLTLYP